MITVNNQATINDKDTKLYKIIGFALEDGYFLIDQDSKHLVSFWENDITCDVEDLSDMNISMDSTLNELITAFNICNIDDIIKVFRNEADFTINLTW